MSGRTVQFDEKDEPLRADVSLLGTLVGEMLCEQGGTGLFEKVEAARVAAIAAREGGEGGSLAPLKLERRLEEMDPSESSELVRAFDAYFQLINLAERVHRIRRGRDYLRDAQGLSPELICALAGLGLSSICNVLSAVKTAKLLDLGPDDALLTVATDGADMYRTEVDKAVARLFSGSFDRAAAERAFEEHMLGASTEHVLPLSAVDRDRIFNLGYYTWVEQQGVSLDDFERRRKQDFWIGLRELIPVWDGLIEDFNSQSGAAAAR